MYLEYYKYILHIYISYFIKNTLQLYFWYTKLVYLKSAKLELIIGANFVRHLF